MNRRTFGYGNTDATKIDKDRKKPESVEQWWPNHEETDELIRSDPRNWLRVWAANYSYYNPNYLQAYLQGQHVSLETVQQKIDDAED